MLTLRTGVYAATRHRPLSHDDGLIDRTVKRIFGICREPGCWRTRRHPPLHVGRRPGTDEVGTWR